MKKLRYRVIHGYAPMDYIAIDEDELEKAMYAMRKGNTTFHNIKGTQIIKILEDFRYYTGWNDTYSPSSGDDELEIRRYCPSKELFDKRYDLAKQRVNLVVLQGRGAALLDNPEKIDQLLSGDEVKRLN